MSEPTNSADTSDAILGGASLRRVLGWQIALAIVVGNVIGSGIFFKPGTIAADGGRFDLILAVWIGGGVLCLLGALSLAELATMLPQAGGLYVYLREAYGRPVAFLFGWTELLFNRPGSMAALSVAFVGSLRFSLDRKVTDEAQVVLASVVILGVAWVNIIGVLWGGRVQLATTVLKVASLIFVAAAPFILLPWVEQAFDSTNLTTTVTPADPSLAVQLGAVLLAVMWAYNGWHAVTPLAEEIREPQRNIPLALFGGLGILIALYVAANVAYHGVLTMDEMSAAGENAASQVMRTLMGSAGLTIITLVIMCSTFGAINTNLLNAPRITFSMGRDGVFFRGLGRVHANYHTPAAAIAVTALMAIGLIAVVAVAKQFARDVNAAEIDWKLGQRIVESLQQGTMFKLLTNFVIFVVSIFNLLAVFAVVILRWRRPDLPRPYRTWGYPVVPLVYCAVYVWFIYMIYAYQPLESRTGLVLIAAGMPVYFAYQWMAGRAGSRGSH